jgi:hypothetical protein
VGGKILRRLSGEELYCRQSYCTLHEAGNAFSFPTFACLAQKILLLPIGTAGVERSFSTMNRILRSERCRLLPDHVDTLMKLSIEGPLIPDVAYEMEKWRMRRCLSLWMQPMIYGIRKSTVDDLADNRQ